MSYLETHRWGLIFKDYDLNIIVPWYAGLCWFDYQRNRYVTTLIPLNVACAFVRWCWIWVRYRITDWLANHEPKA